jgi:hypothetical protein
VAPDLFVCCPFRCTDDDLDLLVGTVLECRPDGRYGSWHGFVAFSSSNAASALTADGTDFQGRLLHIYQPTSTTSVIATVSLLQGSTRAKRREAAATTTMVGRRSFVRGDAVVDNLAARLGLRKGDILAVRIMSSGRCRDPIGFGRNGHDWGESYPILPIHESTWKH